MFNISAGGFSLCLDLGSYGLVEVAVLVVDQHLALLAEDLFIFRRVLDLDRFRMMEAVSTARPFGLNAKDVGFDHVLAEAHK